METRVKTVESKKRIQYHDCDPFNHLNNSRYIDYIMGARTEQILDHYGFNTAQMLHERGIGWVAAQTQISYFSPASWMEVVTIHSRLIQFSEHSLLVEAFMWDEHKTKIKAVMWAKLVHFDVKAQRSNKHSEDLMQLFSEILDPLEHFSSFEERIKGLREIKPFQVKG
ncbi:MAG: acyl-CoA thioesterase [Taibaiella sp.]|nr:acyl-CoA thioesterase [Taibaiella sp.]